MNLHLHIERLVLDGVGLDAAQANALKAGLEAELAQRLGVGEFAFPGSFAEARRTAADVRLGPGAGELGREIGRSLLVSLGAEARPRRAGRSLIPATTRSARTDPHSISEARQARVTSHDARRLRST